MTNDLNDSIGHILKQRRLERGLTLESVMNALRIQTRYLKALEEDRWADLPAQVFLEGFLVKYAEYLGFDGADFRRRLREKMAPAQAPGFTHPKPVPESSADGTGPSLKIILLVAALMLVVGGGLVLFRKQETGGMPLNRPLNQVVEGDPPSTTAPEVGSEGSTSSVVNASSTPTAVEHSVVVRASDLLWIRARVDNGVRFEGMMAAGEVRNWPFQNGIRLRAGNLSRVIVLVDGKAIPESSVNGPGDIYWPPRPGNIYVVPSLPPPASPTVAASSSTAPHP